MFELAATGYTGFRFRSILDSIAERRIVGIDRSMAYRFKIVRRIGPNDIMIVLAARKLGAILATGDWPQASFYMNLTGNKPIYIPLTQL